MTAHLMVHASTVLGSRTVCVSVRQFLAGGVQSPWNGGIERAVDAQRRIASVSPRPSGAHQGHPFVARRENGVTCASHEKGK